MKKKIKKKNKYDDIKNIKGLCFRCQHRCDFLDDTHSPDQEIRYMPRRPKFECGYVNHGSCSCYMFKPIMPCILTQDDKADIRPVLGPPMISSRVCTTSSNKVDFVMDVKAVTKDKFIIYWEPKIKETKKNEK